jgi:aldose 1-epimerase
VSNDLVPPHVELERRDFQGEIDGRPVDLYTLRNRHGMVACITNYGARIEQILVRDRDGRLGDVAQGYDTLEQAIAGQPSMGAFIGRYANRIANARFSLDGILHVLAANDVSTDPAAPRSNTLHGGKRGSRFIPFAVTQTSPQSVEMRLRFEDGEEGFPGTLMLRVRYSVTDADELVIEYDAVAVDRKTVVNFTGHTFFNLSGDLGSSIHDTLLTVPSEEVLEVGPALVPTGRLRKVAGTPMDFRAPKPIGADIGADYDLLRLAGGYDIHYVLDREATGASRLHARAHDPRSGRILEVWSTEPGLQFYSGNYLEGRTPRDVGKGGTRYGFRSAFCLEPSHFPDSVHHAHFPSTELGAGEWYRGEIRYRFRTDRDA